MRKYGRTNFFSRFFAVKVSNVNLQCTVFVSKDELVRQYGRTVFGCNPGRNLCGGGNMVAPISSLAILLFQSWNSCDDMARTVIIWFQNTIGVTIGLVRDLCRTLLFLFKTWNWCDNMVAPISYLAFLLFKFQT